jgi:P4 family phage/plasmid primase-like protien
VFAIVKAYLDTITEDYPTRLVNETLAFAKGLILISDWVEADNTKFIPFKNGVLDVETMQLLPHDPSYGFRWQMPRDYSVISDGWVNIDKFLNEFSNQNQSLKNVLLAFCNATLMGRSDLQKFLFLSGSGGNGKGVFMNLLKSLVGEDNTRTTSLASLNDNRFEAANIKNKRLVLCPDEDRKPDSLTVFKSATGGDNISCEFKGKQSIDFQFGGIFVIAANQAIFRGENHEAMKRRKVDFPCKHRPTTKDHNLVKKLILELPMFTTYILSLDPDWVESTIRESGTIPAIAELARDMSIREDSVAAYFHRRLIYDPNESTKSGLMYKDYQSYCQDSNIKPLSANTFPGRLEELCRDSMGLSVSKKETKSGNIFKGLRIATILDEIDEVEAVEAGGGEGGGINPILRKESGGGGGISPYISCTRIKENIEGVSNNDQLINNEIYRCDGVLASTASTESLEDNQSKEYREVEALKQTPPASTHASTLEQIPPDNIKKGDRVRIIRDGESGVVERIGRHERYPKVTGLYVRIIMDNGKPREPEFDARIIEKIE